MASGTTALKHVLFWLLILGLIIGGYWRSKKTRQGNEVMAKYHVKESFAVMGTFATVQFWEADPKRSAEAIRVVKKTFSEINSRFSNYNPETELSRLNASAFDKPFQCSPEMWDMLKESREAYVYTHGAFDISAGPMVKLWGIYRKEKKTLPTAEDLAAARAKVGLDKVIFDDAKRTVKFTVDGMYLDVGGIAKGYAVDQAAEAVKKLGIRRGIIDLGGNIYCFPETPRDRSHYFIHIRNPRSTRDNITAMGYVSLKDMAIATSGDYERFVEIDGKHYAHIMDPTTGKPVTGIVSVSVLAHSATITDTLSTGIFVNGGKYLDELKKRFPELNVMIVREPSPGDLKPQAFPAAPNLWEHIKPVERWGEPLGQ